MSCRANRSGSVNDLGLPAETRKFTPHVTIGRIRGVKPQAVAQYLSGVGGFQSQPFAVDRFALLSSRNSTGGGPYVVEESYELVEKEVAQA